MLRPESRTEPAGVSPAWLGTGAPSSRPQSSGETLAAERGVESLFGGSKIAGVAPLGASSAASSDSQWESRAAHVTVKAMSARPWSGVRRAGLFGVWEAACDQGL